MSPVFNIKTMLLFYACLKHHEIKLFLSEGCGKKSITHSIINKEHP